MNTYEYGPGRANMTPALCKAALSNSSVYSEQQATQQQLCHYATWKLMKTIVF